MRIEADSDAVTEFINNIFENKNNNIWLQNIKAAQDVVVFVFDRSVLEC